MYFRKLKEEKNAMEKFTQRRIQLGITLVGISLFIADMYTDVVLGISYLNSGDNWNGWMTLILVMVPALFNSIYTSSLHFTNKGLFIQKLKIPSALVYPFCAILHGQLSRLITWVYFLQSQVLSIEVAKDLVWVNRDMVLYPEIFIQSIPQLYLQFYIIIVLTGDYTPIQVFSCVTSVFAASWGVLTLFNSLRNKLLAFQLSAFWFISRVAAIAVAASIHKAAPFIVLSIHFILVLPLWFYEIKKKPFQRGQNSKIPRWQIVITDTFYAVVYGVCNTATPIISAFYFPLSFLFLAENLTCYLFAYRSGEFYNREMFKNNHLVENATIKFKDWKYVRPFLGICLFLSTFAFLQCVLIFVLKYRNVIKGDFFHSQIITLIKAIRQRKKTRKKTRQS